MNILHLFSVKKRRPSIHWHGWNKTWANQKQACLAQNLQWQLQTYWSVHDPLMTYKPNCSTCLDLIALNSSRMFLNIGRKLLIHTIKTRRWVVLYFYSYFFFNSMSKKLVNENKKSKSTSWKTLNHTAKWIWDRSMFS